jgi:hypothetical protein
MVKAGDQSTVADLATMIVTSAQFRNVAGKDDAALNTRAALMPANSPKAGKP